MKILAFLAVILLALGHPAALKTDDVPQRLTTDTPDTARPLQQFVNQLANGQAVTNELPLGERPLAPDELTARLEEQPLEGLDRSTLFSERERCFDREFHIEASGLDIVQEGLRNLDAINFNNQSVPNIFAGNSVDNSQLRSGGNLTIQTYDVQGNDIVELLISIEERNDFLGNAAQSIEGGLQEGSTTSLRAADDSIALAQTNVFFNFETSAFLREGVCRASRFITAAAIEYTLPNWVDRETSTDERLNQQWDDFLANLILHETGHGIIAFNLATRLQEILLTFSEPLDENNNCPEGVGDRLNDLLNEAFVFQDAEYDELTDSSFLQQQCLDNPFFTIDRSALSEGIVRRLIIEPISDEE